MLSFPLAEVFNTKMYLKHEKVGDFKYIKYMQNLYFNYKIQITFVKLTKYIIHEMYFNYAFQLLVFQLVTITIYNTA